jgi:uncharacterized membrane protein
VTSKLGWLASQHLRKVWVRVVAFALLAVATAAVAQFLSRFIPSAWAIEIGSEAVDDVLTILASSMLAVTTFSLSIAVSAFAAAASTATPRATALLQEDRTTQNVLATFLGAFLFSLVGIIALQAGFYTDTGRLVLFAATALVVALVVIALLRWISHLMSFGRMGDTLDRVEAAARESLARRLETPFLGGRPLLGDVPEDTFPLRPTDAGYVRHIDLSALATCGEELESNVWLAVLPGSFVHEARPLLHLERPADEDIADRLRSAFTLGAERTFDQDPRFGVIVLSEIASRALSPAVNDPGTAISVLGRLVRVLGQWKENAEPEIEYPNVHVPPLKPADLMEDAFRPIARDGADIAEVAVRLRKSVEALANIAPEIYGSAAVPSGLEAGPDDSVRDGGQPLAAHT